MINLSMADGSFALMSSNQVRTSSSLACAIFYRRRGRSHVGWGVGELLYVGAAAIGSFRSTLLE